MRERSGRAAIDLKWVLVRRIVLVAILCMAGGATLVLRDVAAEAMRQNSQAAEMLARHLSLQLTRIDAALDRPERFPDWGIEANHALFPGQCVEFVSTRDGKRHADCLGTDLRARIAPGWFVQAYGALFPGESAAERPLRHQGVERGTVRATTDPSAVADRAWADISRLIGVWAATIAAMCALVYMVVERALRPTAQILSGLNRLAEGDLSYRLPRFRLRELDRIAEVFNSLAQSLRTTTQERSELARKLVNAQEQERRHIARELHDDVAQRLSAMNSLAASIRLAAKTSLPSIARQSEELVAMASGTMRSLRETLTHLRPPEIDDLGLLASLQALVSEHNRRAAGETRFALDAQGKFDELPAETAAHVYRIVQEGLNNAARHANARSVAVALRSSCDAQSGGRQIELAISDDGIGVARTGVRDRLSGVGLIGVRERVYALSGSFTAEQSPAGGFALRISFPVGGEAQEAA